MLNCMSETDAQLKMSGRDGFEGLRLRECTGPSLSSAPQGNRHKAERRYDCHHHDSLAHSIHRFF